MIIQKGRPWKSLSFECDWVGRNSDKRKWSSLSTTLYILQIGGWRWIAGSQPEVVVILLLLKQKKAPDVAIPGLLLYLDGYSHHFCLLALCHTQQAISKIGWIFTPWRSVTGFCSIWLGNHREHDLSSYLKSWISSITSSSEISPVRSASPAISCWSVYMAYTAELTR